MTIKKGMLNSFGFTLVEILVVVVIMGLVISSVYGLFVSNNKTANTSEEVVDVQQNLRVAIETIASDVRMSGFLLQSGQQAVTNAPDFFSIDTDGDDSPDSAPFSINTVSAGNNYARVLSESSDGSGLLVEADMSQFFKTGDLVSIFRPTTRNKVSGVWTVGSVSGNKISISTSTYAAGSINSGDMIVKKNNGESEVANIRYWLRPSPGEGNNVFELIRDDGSALGPIVISNKISEVDLGYLMDNGNILNSTSDLEKIRGVQMTISAETDNTKTGLSNYSGVKRRSMQTLIAIRNNIGD